MLTHSKTYERGGQTRLSAELITAATFARTVHIVVVLGAEEQMRWITARRVIATMKYPKTVWNWSVRELPSKSMGGPVVIDAVIPKRAVPSRKTTASPLPAIIGSLHIDAVMESFFKRRRDTTTMVAGYEPHGLTPDVAECVTRRPS